jgi:hypothetical protein
MDEDCSKIGISPSLDSSSSLEVFDMEVDVAGGA